ncbi:MAG: NAD(P)/FAD-dependent oxidoreductase, partial [Oscillospiraceae bacterium]
YKTSLDARKRDNIHRVSSVWAELPEDMERAVCAKNKNCSTVENHSFEPVFGDKKQQGRIAVIGFGPAGMFAALTLAEYGYKPLVLERGGDVDRRTAAVEGFWKGGAFDRASNVQFGEGGAGTFSDGKLTTRIHDPLCRRVLEIFAEMGAPEEILTKAKPHIGTDKLRETVKNIRRRIIELGGEVRFDSQVTDIAIRDGKISSVTVNNEELPVCAAVAAVGHSARDTFSMLLDKGVIIEPKPFSCGARIEHTRQSVNESLYGEYAGDPMLPEGEYQLSYRKGNRAVYTFCMCPGGYVVPSQSEEKTIVTNGMSEFARDGENSNSALVVSVSPEDFGNKPLDGVKFAADIERRAYAVTGSYCAPASTVGAFLDGAASLGGAGVTPSYSLGVVPAQLDDIFPTFITGMMREGLSVFSRKMRCFGDRGAVLTAPETRTSSPVRITRGEDLCALGIEGLYPCGEGAGYAGGIMSAAVDGIRCALEIMKIYSA